MDLAALFVELLGHRIRNGAAHAAAYHSHLLEAFGMGGSTQGAHEIRQGFPGLLVGQLDGGAAHQLVDDGDVALFPVIIGYGKGDALALFVHPQDDKLARLRLGSHPGRMDHHTVYGGV